jgi:hypothetical protein
MTKAVILTEKQWLGVYNSIAKNYPHSVLLIRDKMKEVLGFTVRRHEAWFEHVVPQDQRNVGYNTKYCVQTVHLDFYNEPKRTMFLLKYSDMLNDNS